MPRWWTPPPSIPPEDVRATLERVLAQGPLVNVVILYETRAFTSWDSPTQSVTAARGLVLDAKGLLSPTREAPSD